MGVGVSDAARFPGALDWRWESRTFHGRQFFAALVPVSGMLHLCRDPDDDWVLETAVAGGATHVVSRDEDVTRDLELQGQLEIRGIATITVSRLLAVLEHDTKITR